MGSFQVDILAEDGNGNQVVIENQLEPTNHDHLGKVITYVSNLDAKAAIWITPNPRPEHVAAIHWLNEKTPFDVAFYLVKLEAYRIGDSLPAPLFTVVAEPSMDAKEIAQEKGELSERHHQRNQFWADLLTLIREKGVSLHSKLSPTTDSWLATGAGRTGLSYVYLVWKEGQVGIGLDIATGDRDKNKQIFDTLHEHREEIEAEFGQQIVWDRGDDRVTSQLRYFIQGGGWNITDNRRETQLQMIESMQRFAKALDKHIKSLPKT